MRGQVIIWKPEYRHKAQALGLVDRVYYDNIKGVEQLCRTQNIPTMLMLEPDSKTPILFVGVDVAMATNGITNVQD